MYTVNISSIENVTPELIDRLSRELESSFNEYDLELEFGADYTDVDYTSGEANGEIVGSQILSVVHNVLMGAY